MHLVKFESYLYNKTGSVSSSLDFFVRTFPIITLFE